MTDKIVKRQLEIIQNFFSLPLVSLKRTSFSLKKFNFLDNSSNWLFLECLMVWVLSPAHSNEKCRYTTQTGTRQNNWCLRSSAFVGQYWHSGRETCKSFTPSYIQCIFQTSSILHDIQFATITQTMMNDELVQSRRNLFNLFCHQRKYVFYETQIYIYFKRQTVL